MLQHNDGDEQIESPLIDFAFVVALPIERDALLRRLEGREVIQDDYEPLTYYRGHLSIPTTGEDYQVVAVMLLGMGNDEAAVSTVKVIERWRPAYVLMVGVAGGFPGKVALGDVVISDFVYYYEPAKRTPVGEQRRAQQFLSDRLLYGRALAYEAGEWRSDIAIARPGAAQTDVPFPKAYFGAIGSGEKVIADARALSRLQKECPRLLAVAMEGAGVARAAAQQPHPPPFIEVRGVCDYANEQKNDDWQPFAAEAAAAFTVGLLRSRPVPPLAASTHRVQEKGSFLILCAQSLRPIAAHELLGILEKDRISRSVEVVSLDFTDLVVNGIFTDPQGATLRLTSPQGPLYAALARRGEAEFVFHGLVHIPIAFLAGHLVTDRQPVRLFDFHPGPGLETWAWPGVQGAIPPLEVRGAPERPSRRKGVAVVRISISYTVTAAQTRAVFPRAALEVDLSVPEPERGVVRSEEQVREYGRTFRGVLDLIAQRFPAVQHIHIFYAGPVALAFHLGQQISENIHPAVTVWNFRQEYGWGIDLAAASLGEPCVVRPKGIENRNEETNEH
jgi:5'-methylthioadenosine/S-adenosylhomocysteine nucleosidase